MYTYLGLSLVFVAAALLLDLAILRTRVVCSRSFVVVLVVMLGFTLVFDQLLTGLPIVVYDPELISGWHIGYAPIEDFSYTIAAVIGIGALVRHVSKTD